MAYANGTQVSPGRTRDQIEALLSKFGASQFGYQCRSDAAIIGFEYEGLTILFTIPIPEAKKFEYSPAMRARSEAAIQNLLEAEVRRRWRTMFNILKAMLSGVEDEILTFEQVFLPFVVWASGLTTYDMLQGQIEQAKLSADGSKCLPLLPPDSDVIDVDHTPS